MARQTKERLCEQLTAKGVQFDPEANYSDLYKLLPGKQVEPQVMTTQTTYAPEPEPEVKKVLLNPVMEGQSCGRCKAYDFDKQKGILICHKRGGRRKETAGGDCVKFEAKP